jgi:hypothetical protein
MSRPSYLISNSASLTRFAQASDSQSFSEIIGEIPENEVFEPNIPVGIFLQEAFNIYKFAQMDRETFVTHGLDWRIVEELPKRIEFIRDTEAAWWEMRYRKTQTEKEYARLLDEAEKLRDSMLHHLAYACRGRCGYGKGNAVGAEKAHERRFGIGFTGTGGSGNR